MTTTNDPEFHVFTELDFEEHFEKFAELFLEQPRFALGSVESFPEAPGALAIHFNPESPEADEEDPWGRPRFLELLAAEEVPLFADVAELPGTIRSCIDDVAEFLDQAKGLSWTWFEASFLPIDPMSCAVARLALNRLFRYTPWFWMSFDRLHGHQYTELSACTLLTDEGQQFPSAAE